VPISYKYWLGEPMITKLNLPVSVPWTAKCKWENFGDTFNREELDGPRIAGELREFLASLNLKIIHCSRISIHPNKTQSMYVDSPWCEVDNHSNIIWVDGADVEITFYKITEPLGLDNIEKLFDVKEETDDDSFSYKKRGWIVKKEILVETERKVVKAGEIALINAGIPYLITSPTPVRSKLFVIGIERANKIVIDTNGMTYQEAQNIFKEYE
jgi:hypothetical protein